MPRSRRLPIVLPTGVLPFLRYLGANAEERPVVWTNVANATVAVSLLQKQADWG